MMKKIILLLSLVFCFSSCAVLEVNHDKKVSHLIYETDFLSRTNLLNLSETFTMKAKKYKSFKEQYSMLEIAQARMKDAYPVYAENFIFKDALEAMNFLEEVGIYSKKYVTPLLGQRFVLKQIREYSFGVSTKDKQPKTLFSFSISENFGKFGVGIIVSKY